MLMYKCGMQLSNAMPHLYWPYVLHTACSSKVAAAAAAAGSGIADAIRVINMRQWYAAQEITGA